MCVSQEVRQVSPETPIGHSGICSKLYQLQSTEEGQGRVVQVLERRADRLQLIKQLSATPTLLAQNASSGSVELPDPQVSLQANKATFFFRLVSGRLR